MLWVLEVKEQFPNRELTSACSASLGKWIAWPWHLFTAVATCQGSVSPLPSFGTVCLPRTTVKLPAQSVAFEL